MTTVPSSSEIKSSLKDWFEIIGMFQECFPALGKNKVLEQALLKLDTEMGDVDDVEREGLKEMIEYCQQISVAERKAEIFVGSMNSLVKSTLKALNRSKATDTVKIFKSYFEKSKSKYPELKDAIGAIGQAKDTFCDVKRALERSAQRWDSKEKLLTGKANIRKRKNYNNMASVLPAIATVISVVPFVSSVTAFSGISVGVTAGIIIAIKYMDGFDKDENNKLIKEIEKVKQYFEETQRCLSKSHEAITKKLGLLVEIKHKTDEAGHDMDYAKEGFGSFDDVKEDLESLESLCVDYLKLSSTSIPSNLFRFDQQLQTSKTSKKQKLSKRKRTTD